MANPAITAIPANTWVKVATDVTTGQVWRREKTVTYAHTYRLTGQAAPTDLTDAVVAFDGCDNMPISASAGIDVYIYAYDEAGSVRVDV